VEVKEAKAAKADVAGKQEERDAARALLFSPLLFSPLPRAPAARAPPPSPHVPAPRAPSPRAPPSGFALLLDAVIGQAGGA